MYQHHDGYDQITEAQYRALPPLQRTQYIKLEFSDTLPDDPSSDILSIGLSALSLLDFSSNNESSSSSQSNYDSSSFEGFGGGDFGGGGSSGDW